MKKFYSLYNIAKHPYLLKRALYRKLEARETEKHKKRLSEYKNYQFVIKDVIKKITNDGGCWQTLIDVPHENDIEAFYGHLDECSQFHPNYYRMSKSNIDTILSVSLSTKPETIIETGIASGFSTASFPKALNINKKGVLHSIDLHARSGVTFPENRQLGWVVPEDLKTRWTLHLGTSEKILPDLLKQMNQIDIFMHDSRHLYKTQMFEYTTAYPYIKPNGLLMSDDATDNDAFLDFADEINKTPMILDNKIGIIQK